MRSISLIALCLLFVSSFCLQALQKDIIPVGTYDATLNNGGDLKNTKISLIFGPTTIRFRDCNIA
jgi:hypothetical protein